MLKQIINKICIGTFDDNFNYKYNFKINLNHIPNIPLIPIIFYVHIKNMNTTQPAVADLID